MKVFFIISGAHMSCLVQFLPSGSRGQQETDTPFKAGVIDSTFTNSDSSVFSAVAQSVLQLN